jgi:hypothetical protein
MTKSNWIIVVESQYPWERDALDFVRQRFPDHEPYRAWSNFEFIADDGSINEVDLLALTPQGFLNGWRRWSKARRKSCSSRVGISRVGI